MWEPFALSRIIIILIIIIIIIIIVMIIIIISISKDHDIEITDKWYDHEPETVMHNKDINITIMWDMPVNTNRSITVNGPDIIVKDSVNSACKLIDMTVPSDRNIALKETEKKASTKT